MSEDAAPVVIVDHREKSRFAATIGDRLVGVVYYERTENGIEFIHTEVADDVEGQGVGSQLARAALESARDEGLVVTPSCPFIAGYIDRHPEYASLVAS
jgi:predicted GNAT family acetyltransferase